MLGVVFLLIITVTQSFCGVRVQEPAINRDILGSNGPYRDFVLSDCNQPLETNPLCSEWQYAYHWNDKLKGCERAIYHGCNPTRNNFRTLRDCLTQAESVCTRSTDTRSIITGAIQGQRYG